MSKETFTQSLIRRGLVSLISEGLKYLVTLGLPALMAAMTVISGYMSPGLPWPLIIAAATFVFATTAVGLLRFDEWLDRRTPRNKLEMMPAGLTWVYVSKDAQNKPTGIRAAQIILNFKNNANFPLSIVVEELEASLDGNINADKSNRGIAYPIQAGGTSFFRNEQIPMRDIPCRNLEGKLKYAVRYGRPGHEKYQISEQLNLLAIYDPELTTYKLDVTLDMQKKGYGT